MKKIIVLLFVLLEIGLCGATVDTYAGATLNKKETISEYNRLMKASKEAIKKDDWFLREETIDEIEVFLKTIKQYENISSNGAKENTDKFQKNLEIGISKLMEIDGVAGASLDPNKIVSKYNLVLKLADEAINSSRDKNIAIREVNELLAFMLRTQEGQSEAAKAYLDNFEKELKNKLQILNK